jgi:hypothetical protein
MINGVIPFSRVIGRSCPTNLTLPEIIIGANSNTFGFDGTGAEYLEAPTSASLDTVVAVFGWMYFDANQTQSNGTIIQRQNTGSNMFSVVRSRLTGIISFSIDVPSGYKNLTYPDSGLEGLWTSYGLSYDGTSFKAYINGIQVRELFTTGALDVSGSFPLLIGKDSGISHFQGSSTTHMLFDTVPTGAEMLDLHQAGKSVYVPTLPTAIKDKIVSAYALNGIDATGNDLIGSNHLTLNGGISADGQVQSFDNYLSMNYDYVPAMYFDSGSDTFATVPFDASLNTKTGAFLRLWVDSTQTTGDKYVFNDWNNSADRSFIIRFNTATNLITVRTWTSTSQLTQVDVPFTSDTWFTFGWVHDSGTLRTYIDGVADGTDSYTGVLKTTTKDIVLGKDSDSGSNVVVGSMCNVLLFDDIPTPAEFATLHNGGDAFKYEDLPVAVRDKVLSGYDLTLRDPSFTDLQGANDMVNNPSAADSDGVQPNGEYITFS